MEGCPALRPDGRFPKEICGIMSLDIIPARSEAEWPSSPKGPYPEDML